jgi:hypothetical protein
MSKQIAVHRPGSLTVFSPISPEAAEFAMDSLQETGSLLVSIEGTGDAHYLSREALSDAYVVMSDTPSSAGPTGSESSAG